MTPAYLVRWLCDKMGEDPDHFGIEWHEHLMGGFMAMVNGVTLHIVGSEISIIRLFLGKGLKSYTITEPPPHRSRSPAGRFVSWVRKSLGFQVMKGPETREAKEEEELRLGLEKLLSLVLTQVVGRNWEEYNRQVGQELFLDITGFTRR